MLATHPDIYAAQRQSACCCSAIPSMLTAERKCPHDGACEIDAARTGKTSGTQQLTGWIYDDGAGSGTDGTERTPYQAHTGGIQGEGSSRNSSRQQRSQPCQCYTEHTGDRSSTSGSDQIRRSQPHAPERVAEGARGYRHRSRHVTHAGVILTSAAAMPVCCEQLPPGRRWTAVHIAACVGQLPVPNPHRVIRRQRMPNAEGMLIQVDGSYHRWHWAEDGPQFTLLLGRDTPESTTRPERHIGDRCQLPVLRADGEATHSSHCSG